MIMKKRNIIITEQQLNSLILADLFKNVSSKENQDKIFDLINKNVPSKEDQDKIFDTIRKQVQSVGFADNQIDSEDLKTVRQAPKMQSSGKSATAPTSQGSVDFQTAINKIIDGLEGGYYHPNMKARNPSKFAAMGKSGETMFGMDRLHGNQEKYAAGQEFWKLIDAQNASSNWSYNYKLQDNQQLASQLKKLIGDIMKPLFDNYVNQYLTPEARQIVLSNPPLYFNFVYATWNGPNWFKKFAQKINDQVNNGVKDPNALADVAVQARKNSGNSILSKTSDKVDNIMDTMA